MGQTTTEYYYRSLRRSTSRRYYDAPRATGKAFYAPSLSRTITGGVFGLIFLGILIVVCAVCIRSRIKRRRNTQRSNTVFHIGQDYDEFRFRTHVSNRMEDYAAQSDPWTIQQQAIQRQATAIPSSPDHHVTHHARAPASGIGSPDHHVTHHARAPASSIGSPDHHVTHHARAPASGIGSPASARLHTSRLSVAPDDRVAVPPTAPPTSTAELIEELPPSYDQVTSNPQSEVPTTSQTESSSINHLPSYNEYIHTATYTSTEQADTSQQVSQQVDGDS